MRQVLTESLVLSMAGGALGLLVARVSMQGLESLIPAGLDVLVTHVPPAGIGDDAEMAGRQGCADLRRRVEEVCPRLHLFGHIHRDGGLWREGATTFANVTTWECERGATVIDLDAHAVAPVDVPPRTR